MSSLKLLASLFAVAAASGTLNLTWKDCGDASTHGNIKSVTPASMILGDKTTITASGSVDESVSGGKFTVKLSADSITLLNHTGDICKPDTAKLPFGKGELEWNGVKCPVSAGALSIAIDATLSSSIPTSLQTTTIKLTATTSNGDQLVCLDLNTVPESLEAEFAQFVKRYNKRYASAEEMQQRFENFKLNRAYHESENAKQSTYVMGINEFSDLTPQEFASSHFGYSAPKERWGGLPKFGVHKAKEGQLVAAGVDWVAKGAVTPVKNQGQCGSCWAFSTTGGLEGAWEIATKDLVSLSEQQFVDCSKQNDGCNGGNMDYAFQFAEDKDICTESSYPYHASDGTCSPSGCIVGIPLHGVTGYTDVDQTEDALVSALNQQPVSIAIEADKSAFQSYTSGVLQALCGTQLDHGVLAVGYGTASGVEYWKVKNSWGATWGENGYIRLLRGKGGLGECGILSEASYPQVNGNVARSTITV